MTLREIERACASGAKYIAKTQYENGRQVLESALPHAKAADERGPLLYNLAICHIRLGDQDKAIECLKEAISIHDEARNEFMSKNDFPEIKSDPRYKALVQQCASTGGVSLSAAQLARSENISYGTAMQSDYCPNFPVRPLNLFRKGEPLKDEALANIAEILRGILLGFSSPSDLRWSADAQQELGALDQSLGRMLSRVHSRATVDALTIKKMAQEYIERLGKKSDIRNRFYDGSISVINLVYDFANTLGCGGTLQTALEWC